MCARVQSTVFALTFEVWSVFQSYMGFNIVLYKHNHIIILSFKSPITVSTTNLLTSRLRLWHTTCYYLYTRGKQSNMLRMWVTLKPSQRTWKLRLIVSSTQAPQQIPKPQRRSSRRPEASTMKTWYNKFLFEKLLSPTDINKQKTLSFSSSSQVFHTNSFSDLTSQGTYSCYGHEDIHCSCSHSDVLDVILLDSCTGIYIICIVVDLRRERESCLVAICDFLFYKTYACPKYACKWQMIVIFSEHTETLLQWHMLKLNVRYCIYFPL